MAAAGVQPASAPIPGPELPAVPGRHPALPSPPPSLAELGHIADSAPVGWRFTPGSHPSTIRNAHYGNTRAQLAYALQHAYNSVEGDVRVRDGRAVMQHDPHGRADLTFAQWATTMARAGRHLRIDVKEHAAIGEITNTLEQLGVPGGSVTFNVGIDMPWSSGFQVDEVRQLRDRFPGCWITLNLPVPLGPGYVLASRAAREIGGDHLGVAVMAGLVHRSDIEYLRRSFDVVNVWNVPGLLGVDPERDAPKLRAMGANGMLDLRRADDPLAKP